VTAYKEKQIRSSKLVAQIGTKKELTNTKLQNAKHRITRNRQMEITDRQTCSHKCAQAANR